jgi:tRNA threonylcarbamoyladenosine biosynthesis protein TsaB
MTANASSHMKILALEFSAELRSAALLVDQADPIQVQETNPRERGPLGLIDQVLREAGVEREQINCLAVGLGPGSYTGVRASIALAQGWQLALGTRLLGISSSEGMAALAQARGLHGDLFVVIDAQRGEFYLEQFRVEPAVLKVLQPLRLVDRRQIASLIEAGAWAVGADAASVAAGVTRWLPEAAMVARLAAGRSEFVTGESLEPIYLRESRFVKAPPPRIIPPVK